MLDLRRIQYVTSHYREIQGLRIIPVGIWLILVAIGEASEYVPAPKPQLAAAIMFGYLIGGFVVLALYGAIGKIYERNYGTVHPVIQTRPRALSGCLSGAGFLAILYVGMMLGSPTIASEVNIVLIALLLYAAWRSGWYRKDYLVLVALLLGAQLLASGAAMMAINGAVVIVGGLLDHLLLARTLKRMPEAGHVGSI